MRHAACIPMTSGPGAGRVPLRIFATIADRWKLESGQTLRLIGAADDPTLVRWCRGAEEPPAEVLRRVEDLIAIFARLRTLHPRVTVADGWLHHADVAPSLGGAPLDVMLAEGEQGIARVRRLLDDQAASEGWL